jgi:hypothetical protein
VLQGVERLLRQFRYPLLSREHALRLPRACHVSLQRVPYRPFSSFPLPSTGSPRLEFPRFAGTIGRYDSWPHLSPHSVSFARQYHAWFARSLPAAANRGAGPGVGHPVSPPGILVVDAPGLTRSWGILLCSCHALRPRQDPRTRPYSPRTRPPHPRRVKARCIANFEALSHGFGTRCLRLVRTVQPQLHRSHLASRKTRFRLPASSTGRDWLPAGFHRKVSDHVSLHILPPFPSLTCR